MSALDLVEAGAASTAVLRYEPAGEETPIGAVWRHSEQVARWLTARVGRGTAVGAFLTNTPACPPVVFGIWRSDNTLVSLPYPGRGADLAGWVGQLARMCELAGVELLLVDAAYAALLTQLPVPLPVPVATFQAAAGGGPRCDVDGSGGLVQFTSGSLGRPKGVLLTADALGANIAAILAALRIGPGDVACSWLPLSHDMGFVGMFLTCVAGAARGGTKLVLQTPESFLADPASWLRNCAAQGATVTTAPNFAFDLAVRSRRFLPGIDLSALRVCITGAERVQAATLERFTAAYAGAGFPPLAICPAYGMAEVALAVSVVRPEEPWRTAASDGLGYVGTGRPVDGLRVRVLDAAGGAAAPGAVGEVQVTGTSLLSGYLGAPDPFTADGWLPTRDLGFEAGGELFLVGRSDETIIVGGQNHYAQDVEAAVRHAAVRAGCLAAVPLDGGYALLAELTAAAEAEPGAAERVCRELMAAATRDAGIRPAMVAVLPRGRLLKTPSGKLQRVPLAAAIQRDDLEVVASLRLAGAVR